MKRIALAAAIGMVATIGLPAAGAVLSVAALAGPISGAGGSPPPSGSSGGGAGSGSVDGIPVEYRTDAEQAGDRFGVPWAVIAGIYYEECDFGQSELAGCHPEGSENSAGAQGPGQFLAPTWRRGLAPHEIIPPGPPTSSDAAGYATDGDGDGVADPWDPADAIASTARLLAANGAASGNVSGAVFAYNHDPSYVDAVLARATAYEQAAAAMAPGGAGSGEGAGSHENGAAVAAVLAFAQAQLGKPYQWAGSGPAAWDCSGLVQAAFAQIGVALTHDAAAQYAATAADAIPATSALQPGDLVFFGPNLPGIEHVGIVVGAGQMIDAPHTGAVVRVESYRWANLVAATRPL